MDKPLVVRPKTLAYDAVLTCLQNFDSNFDPPFSVSIDLARYADKLYCNAKFIVAELDDDIVGLLAYYQNIDKKFLYIPYFVVTDRYQGKSIGRQLLEELEGISKGKYDSIYLEVLKRNISAYHFYTRNGFIDKEDRIDKLLMQKYILCSQ